jgi:hypothetical protein
MSRVLSRTIGGHIAMDRSRIFAILLAIGLAISHFLFLFAHCSPSFLGPDANGYFAQAAQVATSGRTALEPESPLSYIGTHWLETADGRFFSRYPPGVGILVAIPYELFGPEAGLYLTPLLASLTLLLLFFLCRLHAGEWFALGAALLFAVHPTANQQAFNWGAHTAVTFFIVAELWLLSSWARRPAAWKAALAGLVFGLIPALRYAEVVAGFGVAGFMLYYVAVVRRDRWRDLIAAFSAAAIPLGLLMWRNALAFGSPFKTGYALTNEQQWGSGFSFAFFELKWLRHVEMLMGPGMGLFFALGLAGLVALCARKRTRSLGILLVGVIVPVSLVYTAYYFGRFTAGELRFLLPTLPLYLISAFCFSREYGKSTAVRAGFVFLVLAQVGLWVPETIDSASQRGRDLTRAATAIQFVRDNVPPDGVVIADSGLQEHLMYYPGLRLVDAELVLSAGSGNMPGLKPRGGRRPGANPGAKGGRFPLGKANPRQHEKASRLRAQYDVEDQERRTSLIIMDLYELAGDPPVLYWIGQEDVVRRFGRLLDAEDRFVKIGEIDLPGEPERQARRERGDRPRTGGHVGLAAGAKLELFKLESKRGD